MSSPAAVAPVVSPARSMIYLGMDVHKDSITIAVLPQSPKTPTRLEKLANDLPKLKKWIERIARDGEIHACYEASGAGYVLHRALAEWGYACDVIAPSLIPKRSGVHRKHDKRVGGRIGAALSGRRADARSPPSTRGPSSRRELPRGWLPGSESLHIGGGERLTPDGPIAAADLLDDTPRH